MPGKLLYLFLLLPCCLLLTAAAQHPDKPVRRNLGEKVTMLIPENFTQMPEDEMAQKYPSARKPVCIYTNPAHNVDISLNISNTVWGENDIEMLRDFYRSNIKQLYTKVTFSIDEIQKINKRRYVVFEFISESSEKESGKPSIRKYTYIQIRIYIHNTNRFTYLYVYTQCCLSTISSAAYSMYIYVCVCIYVYIFVCIYKCIYICVCVCIYKCIHMCVYI